MTAETAAGPSICLAIPFYSNVDYLRAALLSLVAQSDQDWTAVVVDDASAEPDVDRVVAELGDRRIGYVRNEVNLGIAANFNRCLELGAEIAEVVVVFHADDELHTGYVAAIRRTHGEFPAATCVAPRAVVIGAGGAPARTLADSVKQRMWPRNLPTTLAGDHGLARLMHGLFFYCPAVSYRVELLPELRFDRRWQQVMDVDLYARVLLDGGSIVLVADTVYRYRRHGGTMTAQNSRSLVRLGEEVAVSREVSTEARRRAWHRSARAGRWRVTARLNGLLSAGGLLARGQVGAAREAGRRALSR